MTRLADALKRANHPAEVQAQDPAAPDVDLAGSHPVGDRPAAADERPWFVHEPIQVGDPAAHAPRAAHDFSDRLARKLVTDPESRPVAVEQYRRLAAALHHTQAQSGIKVVMVTSAVVAEGKSLSVCNLGLTLSHSYHMRVLLIDADLRRPSLHEMFKLPPTAGFSERLRAKDEREMPLFEVSPGLVVLPAGRPDADPVGGLTSDRVARVFAEAKETFDWVLIDTPPLGLVPDAALLSTYADTVLLVVRAGASPCALVRQAVETLGADRIFGVLLNAAELGTVVKTAGYYSYGYYSGAGRR
jgi:capsular exopolysaccharide synthesis family protein